ncbi:GerB family spore germination protein [Gracilibacillus halophilus YIM-C55.5]|uniref:GerB family spore germination protein n=1 Tax=Gracilibacillus halophilus YIM-C55.5 TaxID=1308866 RepID=N4WUL1_9BACI|nr:GerAB/ArcD/ProY family transporter [Gracilibacillus halophilus]ENH96806.1 GerB family spore germination protein [Gracilibacillus halophilus YIM-C55.5]
MKQHQKPDITQMVSPFLLLYILHATQVGEGILSFERKIAKLAGYDAWMSIILTGILTTIVIWLIWQIIRNNEEDIIDVHHQLFGKWIGNLCSILLASYFFIVAVSILRSYIEVFQIWFFPDLSIWFFTLVIYILMLYIILGGFRVVVGFAFFSVFITFFLAIFKYAAFTNGYMENLFPMMNTEISNIIRAVEPMMFSFLGIELILLYAPFIKNFQRSKKWAIWGNIITTLVYFISCISIFVYFNETQIQKIAWPTLHLWKIIDYPFIQRFEYLGISLHFFSIIATSCMYFWSTVQTWHRMTNHSFRNIAFILATFGMGSIFLIDNFIIIERSITVMSKIGVIVMVIYIPLLFVWRLIISGVKRSNENH